MASRFEIQINGFRNRIWPDFVNSINVIGLDGYGRIIRKTPRDTGRAAGSWQYVPATVANPVALIFSNLVYIVPLNNGWSKKAPNGMVEVSIAEIQEIYR